VGLANQGTEVGRVMVSSRRHPGRDVCHGRRDL